MASNVTHRVGVAGGTGGLGRTIVEHIANTGRYTVYVLTRSATGVVAGRRGVEALELDYSSPSSIAERLRAENIDTVVSVIGMLSEDDHRAQLNLIEGAALSGTVTRFAPSEYGWDYEGAAKHGFPPNIPVIGAYKPATYKAETIEKLRSYSKNTDTSTSTTTTTNDNDDNDNDENTPTPTPTTTTTTTNKLTFTRFISGLLMDFFGHPHEPVNGFPVVVALDVENARAAIPGTGNANVAMTHSSDIGAFVARMLALESGRWPEKCWIVGDRLTWNEALVFAERARDKMFDMKYDALTDLKAGRVTELPANRPRYALASKQMLDGLFCVWGIAFAEGWFDFPGDTITELFPDMKTTSFEKLVQRSWASKSR
ncbi:hypothetical protein DBV05_g1254 [Lasiodiplodia theobromae]|uniref:NmrA-like domain-containing protein n=1 Tax=Lasiodiplodia theobromae TaxID=45133 RepID=A0A5N5DRE6_9PEZI|nr:hypothetical protein DBV05_g1254 [Lasiodiplodia theobromae]